MNKIAILLSLSMLSMIACEEELTQEEQDLALEEMWEEIQTLASSVDCDHAEDWTYTAYGSKACGGPVGYIAYPTTIDTEAFLELVEQHSNAQEAYNEANGIGSDCSVPSQPIGVICEEGQPVLVYE